MSITQNATMGDKYPFFSSPAGTYNSAAPAPEVTWVGISHTWQVRTALWARSRRGRRRLCDFPTREAADLALALLGLGLEIGGKPHLEDAFFLRTERVWG